MIRVTGCMLVLLSCGLGCLKLHIQLEDNFREWCLFQGVLMEIRRNNNQACVVMAALMKDALKSMPQDSVVAKATVICEKRLTERCMPMEWIWEQYIDMIQRKVHLPTALLIQVKRLGSVLSHKDSETIEHYLGGVLGLLSDEIEERSKNMKTRDVVRSSLCAMTGIMTILLLI